MNDEQEQIIMKKKIGVRELNLKTIPSAYFLSLETVCKIGKVVKLFFLCFRRYMIKKIFYIINCEKQKEIRLTPYVD